MMVPRPPVSHHKPTWRDQLLADWQHLSEMPTRTFSLLALLTVLAFCLSPVLPLAAYLLHRWAANSWDWRNRWASLRMWARQGTWFIVALALLILANQAHLWIIPQVVVALHVFWQAHLPGHLSLAPFDLLALPARTLLLLPLAPTLCWFYEHIDPRTSIQLHRVLIPKDLIKPPKKVAPPASEPVPAASQAANVTTTSDAPTDPPKAASRKKKKATPTATTPEDSMQQTTIDSFLSPASSAPTEEKRMAKPHKQPAKTARLDQPAPIDWDDIAE